MTAYLSFLAFATVLVLIPGADFAVTVKNTLAGGATRGRWTALGVTCSNVVQGLAAVAGLGAVVVRSQPVFLTIKWAGIAYLAYLAVQAIRSAVAGDYRDPETGSAAGSATGPLVRGKGWSQGFLSNITNPKVLVFYLAVLPQFLGPHSPVAVLVLFALSHAAIGLLWSMVLVAGLERIRGGLSRRRVRRTLDAATGAVLLGFGARLALEQT